MGTERWSDEFLDEMRQQGDPLADHAVDQLFASGQLQAVHALMNQLVENDDPLPDDLPNELKEYFDNTGKIPETRAESLKHGERLFFEHGPEILMVLACYSLPAAYAARNGVQVLHRTGFIGKRPNRRLFETAQLVVDVLAPGGFEPRGKAVRTAQKVRLMHAAVRHLILHDPGKPWDLKQFGRPINQEDLAGTLMVFSYLIIEGLGRLGNDISSEQKQAYLEVWQTVGRIMGLREELIPLNLGEAKVLTETIQGRQIAYSQEGREMTAALLENFEEDLPPGPFRGFPGAFMRHFLPSNVADDLGIPKHNIEEKLIDAFECLHRTLARHSDTLGKRSWVIRQFSLHTVEWLVRAERGGNRSPFFIPDDTHSYWRRSHRENSWQRLLKFLVSRPLAWLRSLFGGR